MLAQSLDEFVRCEAPAGCEWRVLVPRGGNGYPRLCDDHGGAGYGLPQFLDDEEGRIAAMRHCSDHVNECELD